MGAKRSGEMKYAISMYKKHKNVYRASQQAGVHPTSLYRALDKMGLKRIHRALLTM